MASSGVDVAVIIGTKTGAVPTCSDLFEICAFDGAVVTDWDFVAGASPVVHYRKGARATARRRSVSVQESRENLY